MEGWNIERIQLECSQGLILVQRTWVCVCVKGVVWVGDRKTGRQSVCAGCDWPDYRGVKSGAMEGGGSFKTMSLPDLSIQGGTGTR